MSGLQGRRPGQRYILDRELGGRRLEEVLTEFRPDLSRSAVARLIKRGGVRVDGHLLRRTGMRLAVGSRVEVDWDAGRERPANERPTRKSKEPADARFGRDYAGPLSAEPESQAPDRARQKQDKGFGRDGGAAGRPGDQSGHKGAPAGQTSGAAGRPSGGEGQDGAAGPSGYRRSATQPVPDASSGGDTSAHDQSSPGIQGESQEPNCLESGEPAHRLLPGLDPEQLAELVEEAANLDVIYADDDIVVVNKPAGMLTHGTEKHRYGSLADLARLRYGRMPLIMGDDRPGIVHRLDRESSGAIVLARTPEAMDDLREQFRNRQVEKVYLAICHRNADFEQTVLEWDLEQKPGDTDRQEYLAKGQGKEAVTEVCVEERFGHATLVSCVPKTGRRHQIRVHLYAAGLPIIGDELYGGRKAPQLPNGAPRLRRHALHAVELTLRHPSTGEYLGFGAEMPSDMEHLLDWLRG